MNSHKRYMNVMQGYMDEIEDLRTPVDSRNYTKQALEAPAEVQDLPKEVFSMRVPTWVWVLVAVALVLLILFLVGIHVNVG